MTAYPVAPHLGAEFADDPDSGWSLSELIAIAVRRNPRRAHLLVSPVLGKHVPVRPDEALAPARALAERVAMTLDGSPAGLVLGYAETATGLGHCVAGPLGAPYLHSTRRSVPGAFSYGGFTEEHSHATLHQLLPDDPHLLSRRDPVVLVDDEVSTGRTALNTIEALQARCRRARYVVAALVDVRSAADRAAFAAAERSLGLRIDVVSLAGGDVRLPGDFAMSAAGMASVVDEPVIAAPPARPASFVEWPATVREGGRHGFTPVDDAAARGAARSCAARLAPGIEGGRVLVLGTEELMYAPLLVAAELQNVLGPAREVRFSSTTRSPVVVYDSPGYPIRTRLAFPSTDDPIDGPGPRFAYNVAPSDGEAPFTDVVVVVDSAADSDALHAPGGLLAQVASVCERLHLLTVPTFVPAALSAAR